ncbi:pyridoxal 5'-phosphate synthase glutaminase subunit PdxT [Pasteuria penetrans]|uniref:pyridoxal 5'-phosphate synthase glutaminase subunit PdxT n=1 Tax=Pasteuria penetrans TaxID=86005 RepID=UPI000FB74DDF|nr:pyridoxal 5'-phosphate synthase glutaminase subunit PdxT [Pasteuria penetrans]
MGFQGAIREHAESLYRVGVGRDKVVIIKQPSQLKDVAALILPGGESTTIGNFLGFRRFRFALEKWYGRGRPIFATCAGLILLSRSSVGSVSVPSLGWLDVTVRRNAFGRQVDSFEALCTLRGERIVGENVPAIFIRAPIVESVGEGVEIIARVRGAIVAVMQKGILATSFHPELTEDLRLHQWFVGEAMKEQGEVGGCTGKGEDSC